MKHYLIFALLLMVGCSSDGPITSRIWLGQAMAEARQTARLNGYTLQDASALAMAPTPDGFYIAVASDEDLLVLQDKSGRVKSLTIITNLARPKSERTYRDVEEYDLPVGGG